mgnify:CR=1 FL=1
MVITYGDHYPAMYEVYKQLGWIEAADEDNITASKYPNLFHTPYMVYSNCDDGIKVLDEITPNMMGIYILQNVKLTDIPWYYKVLLSYFEKQCSYEDYLLIQYDELLGEKYWEEYSN